MTVLVPGGLGFIGSHTLVKLISVLNLIHTFEKVTGEKIPYEIIDRREGDIVISIADVDKVEEIFGWKADYSLEDMCIDSWRWYQKVKEYTV